jgi:hypothetical protein
LMKLQSLHVQRLLKYDNRRSTLAEEELWRVGPDFNVVTRIVSHHVDPKHDKEVHFKVEFDDGTIDFADIRDLQHNDALQDYCKKHGISQSRIKYTVRMENRRAKGLEPYIESSTAADAVTEPDPDDPVLVSTVLRRHARRAKVIRDAPKGEIVTDGVKPKHDRLFKVGQSVSLRYGNSVGEIIAFNPPRGGHWFYQVKFSEKDQGNYIEANLTAWNPESRTRSTATRN